MYLAPCGSKAPPKKKNYNNFNLKIFLKIQQQFKQISILLCMFFFQKEYILRT